MFIYIHTHTCESYVHTLPSPVLASGSRTVLNRAVLVCMFPWRTKQHIARNKQEHVSLEEVILMLLILLSLLCLLLLLVYVFIINYY